MYDMFLQGPDPYASLYPPLRATLVVLSKLYRAVDTHIFSGLAQEAVAAVTLSVQQASRAIARKSTTLDAQLFMIKHLLFLREQIAPFDVSSCTHGAGGAGLASSHCSPVVRKGRLALCGPAYAVSKYCTCTAYAAAWRVQHY
jgi:hypothetical protein